MCLSLLFLSQLLIRRYGFPLVISSFLLFDFCFFFLQSDGRLRFSKQNVIYKSSKTGKVDNIPAGDLNQAQWRRVCLGHGIKLGTSTGHVYKYDGFRDTVSGVFVMFLIVYCRCQDMLFSSLSRQQWREALIRATVLPPSLFLFSMWPQETMNLPCG